MSSHNQDKQASAGGSRYHRLPKAHEFYCSFQKVNYGDFSDQGLIIKIPLSAKSATFRVAIAALRE
jgi:hypothetical protein